MAEQIGTKGYLALGKQTNPTTPVVPSVFGALYKESLSTDMGDVEDMPLIGSKAARYQMIQGLRTHGGEITMLAEPNTAALLFDALLTRTSTTGSNPYTHTYNASLTQDPNFYTIDISTGEQVFRYFGCGLSEITIDPDKNKLQFKGKVSALGSFLGREIASTTTNVVTLKTDYDPAPTTGLVVGDLVRIKLAAGTAQDFVISALTATTITVSGSPSGVAAGDMFYIRPATPSLNLRTALQLARTQVLFGNDATTALAAAQTPVELDTSWTTKHMFNNDEGEQRTGSYDPNALVRTVVDGEIKIKRYFDTKEDLNAFLAVKKRAIIFRMFSEAGYEVRVTFYDVRLTSGAKPVIDGQGVIYCELGYTPTLSNADGKMYDVQVINALATV